MHVYQEEWGQCSDAPMALTYTHMHILVVGSPLPPALHTGAASSTFYAQHIPLQQALDWMHVGGSRCVFASEEDACSSVHVRALDIWIVSAGNVLPAIALVRRVYACTRSAPIPIPSAMLAQPRTSHLPRIDAVLIPCPSTNNVPTGTHCTSLPIHPTDIARDLSHWARLRSSPCGPCRLRFHGPLMDGVQGRGQARLYGDRI